LRILASNWLAEAREGRAPSTRPILNLLKRRRALGIWFQY